MKVCQPMQDAGIINPDSQAGIDICLGCTYKECVESERPPSPLDLRRKARKAEAMELTEQGLSVKEIAERIGVGVKTVQGYLR